MKPIKHIIIGFLFSLICFFLFPKIGIINVSIIFFSSFLIDVDHYLFYVKKKKDFNPMNAYKWFLKNVKKFNSLPFKKKNNFYVGFCFLHGIEILGILLLLTIFSKYFFFVFIGFSLHMFFDLYHEISHHQRIDKFSSIYDFFKFKKMRFIENV